MEAQEQARIHSLELAEPESQADAHVRPEAGKIL